MCSNLRLLSSIWVVSLVKIIHGNVIKLFIFWQLMWSLYVRDRDPMPHLVQAESATAKTTEVDGTAEGSGKSSDLGGNLYRLRIIPVIEFTVLSGEVNRILLLFHLYLKCLLVLLYS